MRLLLVRHAETPSNVRHLLDTAPPGPALTALGEEQAAALPAALADEDIEAVYASTLIRARLTAAPLAAARRLDVRVRDGIREIAAGDLEMLPGDSEQGRLYMKTVFAWAAGDTALRLPGGESGAQVLARYDAVVAEAARSGAGTVALVSHGAAIRMWTAARAGNVSIPFAAAHPLRNTGVVALEGGPATGWTALTWADETVVPPGEPGPTGEAVPDAEQRP
ncbi:histidine phosphatase family protein [Streptomyces sp. Ru71]|uniref:histidine phosphatase family protein n=1 Tax=Streptomyces sp. Ru71 TaxID=2080746 RepID=UPI000CDD49AE|nr:histidine phosphatase family protein [Streptomyces sp. Ru71]POX50862.1 histidine phosphatase family protein [Streptomyces sp. Ru71]